MRLLRLADYIGNGLAMTNMVLSFDFYVIVLSFDF